MPNSVSSTRNSDTDWKNFAADIIDHLLESGCGRWSHRVIRDAKPSQPHKPTAPAPRKKLGGTDQSGWGSADDIDSILDEIEDEDFGPLLPPCPASEDIDPRERRPLASTATIAVQLGRQFHNATGLSRALSVPGGITHIATGVPELDESTIKILDALMSPDGLCATAASPVIFSAGEIMASASKPRSQVLGAFDDKFRDALIENRMIVVVSDAFQSLPPEVAALVTQRIALPTLDAPMLCEVLAHLFPGSTPVTLDDADLAITNAHPEALTLCARAESAEAAVALLRSRGESVVSDGPGLDDFPLHPSVREPLDQLIADLTDFRSAKIPWSDVQRGILLVGPPGCGKTEIPRLLARSVDIPLLSASMAAWQSGGARSSDLCREMRQSFSRARAMAPCILHIDELDTFGDRARPHDHNSAWSDMVIGALLECLDGFEENEGVVVIAATNHLRKIDAALRRPGRFDRVVTMDHPGQELMPQALRWHLRHDLDGVDLTEAAMAAAGMSGAEVAATVRHACAMARRRKEPMTLGDLIAAIRARRPRVDAGLHWRIAVHECGHAIAGHLVGRAIPKLLTINGSGGDAAMLRRSCAGTRMDYENDLILLMAGRAAERLVLGGPSGGAGGDESSDLAQATRIATGIEASYGLGTSGTVWQASPEQAVERLRFDQALRDRVQAHLLKAEAEAARILKANLSHLEAMAKNLAAKGVLTGQPLRDFLDRLPAETSPTTSSDEPQPSPTTKAVADQDNINLS